MNGAEVYNSFKSTLVGKDLLLRSQKWSKEIDW